MIETLEILAELGFGPNELERKRQQTEARQLKRWGVVDVLSAKSDTSLFDPDDPKELERTAHELGLRADACKQCGKQLPTRTSKRGSPRLWCSDRCRMAHNYRLKGEETTGQKGSKTGVAT